MTDEDDFRFPTIEEAAAVAKLLPPSPGPHWSSQFTVLRERQLAAERDAHRKKLARGELVIEPPSASDGPDVVAVITNKLAPLPGASPWVQAKRRETLAILTNGALQMARTGLVLDGTCTRPDAATVPPVTTPAPRRSPRPAKASTEPVKARKTPQKAAQLPATPRHKPKVRPAPKPRPERPALPDELRCVALNSRGLRCKLERVAGGPTCLLHS